MPKANEWRAGWPVVTASLVGMMVSAWTLPFYLLGPLTLPLMEQFGWSKSGLALSASALSIGATIGAALFGRVSDLIEVRKVALISLSAFGFSLLLAPMISALWQLQLLYFTAGLLGAGCGGIAYMRAIGSRFQAARGVALAVALSGTGLAAFSVPLVAYAINAVFGWEGVFVLLGAVIILVGLPAIYWGLGATPKGASQPERPKEAAETGMTRAEAMRDPRFYLIMGMVILFGLFISALIINLVPILQAQGLTAARAAAIASSMGLAMIIGRLGVGWLLDRWPPSLVGAGTFAVGAIGSLLLALAGAEYALLTVISMGLLVGAEVDLLSFIVLRYFGVRNYGEIYGWLYGAYTLVSMACPPFGALLLEQGGYRLLFGSAAASFGLAVLLFVILAHVAGEVPGVRKAGKAQI